MLTERRTDIANPKTGIARAIRTKLGGKKFLITNLHHISKMFIWNLRKLYREVRVDDGLELEEISLEVLEGCSSVHHVIQYTAQGPDITFYSNL